MRTYAVLICLLVGVIFCFPAQAFAASPFELDFDQTGYFNFGAEGEGLYENPVTHVRGTNQSSGTVSSDIQGTPVFGMTYWQGYGPNYWAGGAEAGQANVTFNGNPISGTALAEQPGGDFGVGFKANVTPYLSQGVNPYTIGGVKFGDTPTSGNGVNNGFALMHVSEDPTQMNYGRLMIKSGNDYAFHGFGGNNGPNTQVLGFSFDPVAYDRDAEIYLIYAGGEDSANPSNGDRRSYLWYDTNETGIIPADLVDEPGATQYPEPHLLFARSGFDWDVFHLLLPIPSNATTLALQTESDDEVYNGESFVWVGATAFIPEGQTTIPEPSTLLLLGIGLSGFLAKRFR